MKTGNKIGKFVKDCVVARIHGRGKTHIWEQVNRPIWNQVSVQVWSSVQNAVITQIGFQVYLNLPNNNLT